MATEPGYRFAEFYVSRRRRQVWRGGEVLPLIPRYFDLLVLLIERRQAVVSRRDIFDAVWGDVFVSDGALTQAVRTLRRALGDDSREPVFIRTVSRHGYSFVFPGVIEEDETVAEVGPSLAPPTPAVDVPGLVTQLLGQSAPALTLEERRDIAQRLHGLSTERAVAHVIGSPDHGEALALLRDTRWEVPGAGSVPLWGAPDATSAVRLLITWRVRDALRITSRRWAQAAGGAAAAGALAGLIGGILLLLAPGSLTPPSGVVVLMVLGAAAGFVGAAGVAAGMAIAEAVARSRRSTAMVIGGALGGLGIGGVFQLLFTWTMAGVFGLHLRVGGPLEGLVIGGAVAEAYALATSRPGGGIVAPSGGWRWLTALACAAAGGLAGAGLSLAGYPLVGGVVHEVAQAFRGSQVNLAPLGAWIGEPAFGPLTKLIVASMEGGLFGAGIAWGLTRKT